jgi:hypothetical protein
MLNSNVPQGTKDKPITITSYPGTRAIVDGTTATPGDWQVRRPTLTLAT